MRISDWSSDVCSSDLIVHAPAVHGGPGQAARGGDRWSPWAAVNGWRMNDAGADDLHFRDRDTDLHCRVEYLADGSVRLFGLESTVVAGGTLEPDGSRSEEHASELQSLMRISYAVFCLKKKNTTMTRVNNENTHM